MEPQTEAKSVEDRIKAALVKSLRLKMDPTAIPDDVPLIGKGLGLDSVSVLQLVGAVEEVFGITVDDTDINRDLFQSVASFAAYVRKKLDTT
jgi:acyl carrier protein